MSKGYLVSLSGGIAAGIFGGGLGGFLPTALGIGINPRAEIGNLALSFAVVGFSSVIGFILGLSLGCYGALRFKRLPDAGATAMFTALLAIVLLVLCYLLGGWINSVAGKDLFVWLLLPVPIVSIVAARKLALTS